jgi:oxygen-independent coproporphyrinogen-3 oxidase
MAGIYIHIPFCRQACSYCDFHFSVNHKSLNPVLKGIEAEAILRKEYLSDKKIETLYFGGGTPSVITMENIFSLLNVLRQAFDLSQIKEFTMEVNPEDINEKFLEGILLAGVNRLSVGLQSMNDDELKWMNRAHSADKNRNVISLAENAGFKNISVDLIFGSRFQNAERWKRTLDQVFDMPVHHISSYNLTIEENTKLGREHKKGSEPAVDDDLSAQLFEILMDEAEKHAFFHYEISNFAKPGFESKHNSSYWKNKQYLGLGPSAHSYNGVSRAFNKSSNAAYIQDLQNGKLPLIEESLNRKEQLNEKILIGLRVADGLSTNDLYLSEEERNQLYASAEKYIAQKYLLQNNNRLILTRSGKQLADRIISDLFF